jgi:hypothetical protein
VALPVLQLALISEEVAARKLGLKDVTIQVFLLSAYLLIASRVDSPHKNGQPMPQQNIQTLLPLC